MKPNPPYRPDDVTPAYQLRYNWTGWPSANTSFPAEPGDAFFADLADAWESDGIRLLDRRWSDDEIHLLTSVTPDVPPETFVARSKGRLQYALRQNETPTSFARNYAMRTVGDTTRAAVEGYLEKQIAKEGLADPAFEEDLEAFTIRDRSVDLSEPVATDSGRYWYNLHLVLVIRDRFRVTDDGWLGEIRDVCRAVADKKRHRLSTLAVVPDHVHMALGGRLEQAPEEIALAYMNNVAHVLGQTRLWMDSYYVGGFGEYDMWAVRG